MHPAAASKMRNPDTNCEQHVVAVVWFHLVSIIQTVNLYLAYADSSHPKQHHQLKILNHMSPAENPDAHVTGWKSWITCHQLEILMRVTSQKSWITCRQLKILMHMSPAKNPDVHVFVWCDHCFNVAFIPCAANLCPGLMLMRWVVPCVVLCVVRRGRSAICCH